MVDNCLKEPSQDGGSPITETSGHIPSLLHSVPWLLGWVWLSLAGPLLAVKLFARVGRALFKRYCCSQDKLAGKVVLITGASSGVGEALSRCLYQRGCRLILASRSLDRLLALKKELLHTYQPPVVQEPIVLQLDITDLSSVPTLLSPVLARVGGHVDVLINNAGQSYRGEAATTLIDVDIKLMLVNYFGHLAVTKAVLPGMLKNRRGHIVSVSSVQGRLAIPYRSCYTASKHALQGYMDCLRAEVASSNIAVSVISPGYIQTNLSLNAITGDGGTYGVVDGTTASGLSPEAVAAYIVTVLESGREETLLCGWHHRLAVLLRSLTPELISYVMKRRARAGVGRGGGVATGGEMKGSSCGGGVATGGEMRGSSCGGGENAGPKVMTDAGCDGERDGASECDKKPEGRYGVGRVLSANSCALSAATESEYVGAAGGCWRATAEEEGVETRKRGGGVPSESGSVKLGDESMVSCVEDLENEKQM